ncbi:hypothetical protein DFQ30_001500 [Apophysomyces sp. BC1015]|nr:hypothetical protein DFQ30_001500 [Apophysomyces sp. BC1015]
MKTIFPRLEQFCTVRQLPYWVGQADIWGPVKRTVTNKSRISGRNLWVVKEEYRAFLAGNCDAISAYWQHSRANPRLLTIGYVRKSPTNESDASRVRLLQLMVDKLYFRGKCEEVYASPCCLASQPILERDSPRAESIIAMLKGCKGDVAGGFNSPYASHPEAYAARYNRLRWVVDIARRYPRISEDVQHD